MSEHNWSQSEYGSNRENNMYNERELTVGQHEIFLHKLMF